MNEKVFCQSFKRVFVPTFLKEIAPPVNTVPPVIVFTDYSTPMTVTNGTWTSPLPILNYYYQWYRAGSPISGANNNTYLLVWENDSEENIYCEVRAENSAGEGVANSNTIEIPAYINYLLNESLDVYAGEIGAVTKLRGSNAFDPIAGAVVTGNTMRERNIAFTGATQTGKMVMVEGEVTNNLLYSQDFRNTAEAGTTRPWTRTDIPGISIDSEIAPDGTTTADVLTESAVVTTFKQFAQSYASWTSGTTYTLSIYVKRKTGNRNLRLIFPSSQFGGGNRFCNFNLDLLTGSPDGVSSYSIQSVGNGWIRCSITATATASGTNSFTFLFVSGSTGTYQGDGSQLIFWGAQLEANGYPRSYVPTTSSIASKLADNLSTVSTKTFTQAGTFLTWLIPYGGAMSNRTLPRIYNCASTPNYILAFGASFSMDRADAVDNNTVNNTGVGSKTSLFSVAQSWNGTIQKHRIYLDGSFINETSTETSFLSLTSSGLNMGNRQSLDRPINGWIYILAWERTLTDAEISLLSNKLVLL